MPVKYRSTAAHGENLQSKMLIAVEYITVANWQPPDAFAK